MIAPRLTRSLPASRGLCRSAPRLGTGTLTSAATSYSTPVLAARTTSARCVSPFSRATSTFSSSSRPTLAPTLAAPSTHPHTHPSRSASTAPDPPLPQGTRSMVGATLRQAVVTELARLGTRVASTGGSWLRPLSGEEVALVNLGQVPSPAAGGGAGAGTAPATTTSTAASSSTSTVTDAAASATASTSTDTATSTPTDTDTPTPTDAATAAPSASAASAPGEVLALLDLDLHDSPFGDRERTGPDGRGTHVPLLAMAGSTEPAVPCYPLKELFGDAAPRVVAVVRGVLAAQQGGARGGVGKESVDAQPPSDSPLIALVVPPAGENRDLGIPLAIALFRVAMHEGNGWEEGVDGK